MGSRSVTAAPPQTSRTKPKAEKPTREEQLMEMQLDGQTVLVANMLIPVDKLVLDDTYQRTLTESRAQRIARDWSEVLLGLVTVSCRPTPDGTVYAILDGQHRARAAAIRREETLWCEVFFDLTPTQEAYIFRERNRKRVPTNSLADFRAALASGDTEAHAVLSTLTQLGLEIGWTGSLNKRGAYTAVAVLSTLYEWGVLKETLTLVQNSWPDQTLARTKPVLMGVGTMVWNFKGQIDVDRFIRVMSQAPIHALVADARNIRASLGKPDWQHLARVLTHHYDKGLQYKLGADNIKFPPKGDRRQGA